MHLRHPIQFEADLDFLFGQAIIFDVLEGLDFFKPLFEPLGLHLHARIARILRNDRRLDDVHIGRAYFSHLQLHESLGQIGANRIHLAHQFRIIGVDVGAILVIDLDKGDAVTDDRHHLFQAFQFAYALLDRLHDQLLHVLRTRARIHGHNWIDRSLHLRILGARHRHECIDTQCDGHRK